jgi:RHS repeat-associated protein
VYDGDALRDRVKGTVNGVTTVYVGNYYEYNVSTGVATSYYYAGSTRVAMRQGSAVYYLFGDHLGSTSVSYRVSDGQTLTQRYYAWGGIRPGPNNALPTDYTFTGQKLDATGLMYYGARYYDSSLGRFLSADTIVPQAGNPQALNRYSYVNNSPLKYVDPSGHCWGFASGLRGTGAYGATCNNIDMALTIVQSPKTSAGQKAGAGAYLFAEGAAHIAVVAGTAVLAGEGIAATGTALSGSAAATGAAGTASTAATAACADGDCTNEAQAAGQVTQQGLNAFAKAAEFGIKSYDKLKELTKGTGLEAHHLIEQRFAKGLGLQAGKIPSVALTPEEHRMFTNAWRSTIGYNGDNRLITTANATLEDIWAAAQKIYADSPELLEKVRQTLNK